MEPSDEALITACRHGDEAAWDVLVTRYERLIFTVARRTGLDDEQAADVLQRVFMILIERIATINSPQRLSAWLAATTRREAWRLRRQERMLLSVDEAEAQQLAALEDNAALPDEVVTQLEEQHEVMRALQRMEPRCRRLLTLLFLTPDPPSYADIAARLDMPVGAIGPTRARCLDKLRRVLEDGRD